MRTQLVPERDYGKIHINKECQYKNTPWRCTEAWHFSQDYSLRDTGTDKILSFLGLRTAYPETDDYRRASLKGIQITDVIVKALIMNAQDQVIAEASGASTVRENKGDLHKTMIKAEKRARMNACKRLPVVSSLFEDSFLSELAQHQNSRNSYDQRANQVKEPNWNMGAELTAVPFGKHEGTPFTELTIPILEWMTEHWMEKYPDVANSAQKVLWLKMKEQAVLSDEEHKEVHTNEWSLDQPPPAGEHDDWIQAFDGQPQQEGGFVDDDPQKY